MKMAATLDYDVSVSRTQSSIPLVCDGVLTPMEIYSIFFLMLSKPDIIRLSLGLRLQPVCM